MLSEIKVIDLTLPNLHNTTQPYLALISKASILEFIQRILFWKDHKDIDHFLM